MNDSHISVRYAKALFQSASDQDVSDRVYSDMELLIKISRIKEFKFLLDSPSLKGEQKLAFIDWSENHHLTLVAEDIPLLLE